MLSQSFIVQKKMCILKETCIYYSQKDSEYESFKVASRSVKGRGELSLIDRLNGER